MASTPAYLTKNRLGIYILQLRVPVEIRRARPDLKPLIRRSLRTRNRRVALRRARHLVVRMEETEFNSLSDWERDAHQDDRLFHLGKPIWETLNGLEAEGDHHALDNYLLSLSPEQERALKHMNKRNDAIVDRIQELLATGTATDISHFLQHQVRPVDERVLTAQLTQLKQRLEQIQEPSSSEASTEILSTVTHPVPSEDANSLPLDVLRDKWLAVQKERMAKGSWMAYERVTALFIQVLTEYSGGYCPNSADIDKSMIRYYKEVLEKIPKHTRTRGRRISEIMDDSLEGPSPKTIKDTLTNVGHFIRWVEGEGYTLESGIYNLLTHYSNPKTGQKGKRVPFSKEDLVKLFQSDVYRTGQWKRASEFWVPLLALFTGGTQSELIQLTVTDIYAEKRIDVIDINNKGDGKRLKVAGDVDGEGRPRIIPIHPILKKLGFLDFVQFRKEQDGTRLFPEEERNIRGQFGPYGNRFRNYRKSLGVGPHHPKELRDFHSFRHLFKTILSDLSADEGIIDDLLGHTSSSRSQVGQRYSHADRIALKDKLIRKIKFDYIDFNCIRGWQHHKFAHMKTKNRP